MIVSCPSCEARFSAPEVIGPSGVMRVSCRSCGHSWKEIETLDVIEERGHSSLRHHPIDDAPEREARRLADIAREAKARFEVEQAKRKTGLKRWGIFAALMLVPVAAFAAFPDRIVKVAPVTHKAYAKLGYEVNLYGLEIRKIERQHAIINGTRVLSVRGDISNISDDVKKIPWLRFALLGPSGEELYTWTLDTASRPLPPGQVTSFTTRIAAPPEAAQNLEIRFAKPHEIGSKTQN